MPRFSIIIPVYNAATTVERCLSSLAAQTYSDYEVICVDDGSKDNTYEVLRRAASSDSRIHIIHKENGGVGSARNAGLDVATGEIILSIDADDTIDPSTLELVDERMAADGSDVCTFGYKVEPPEALHPSLQGNTCPADETIDMSVEGRKYVLFSANSRPFACRMAMSHEFLSANKIRWDEALTLGEDQFLLFAVYGRAHRVSLMDKPLYHYFMETDSLTHTAQVSTSEVMKKMRKHILCERAILADWRSAGLDVVYPAELMNFFLELMLFDASRLDSDSAQIIWAEWKAQIEPLLAVTNLHKEMKGATRQCLAEALACAEGKRSHVSRIALGRYYLAQRGFAAIVRRLAYQRRTHR